MKPSTPIFRLKRLAREIARSQNLPLHAALDQTARSEGFATWSALASARARPDEAAATFARLSPGDLLLLGARPGQGKTLMGILLAAEAIRRGGQAAFFTLEYTEADMLGRMCKLGLDPARLEGRFFLDTSPSIDCERIIDQVATMPAGTLVVVDYLQLLDQQRHKPPLAAQVATLRAFARSHRVILVFLSQIDRSYDPSSPCPGSAMYACPILLTFRCSTRGFSCTLDRRNWSQPELHSRALHPPGSAC